MYIRVKRSKTTYFLQCDPTETVLEIKQKLLALIDQPVSDQRLILVGTGEVLDDSKTLADQKVENDAVVALTLRKGCLSHHFNVLFIIIVIIIIIFTQFYINLSSCLFLLFLYLCRGLPCKEEVGWFSYDDIWSY